MDKKKVEFGSTKHPNNKAPYAKKVIAISSGKGGVGKSTISANVSVALAQKGYKVGLLDADVYGPSIPRLFGIENEKLQWNEKNKIIPSENFGVKIMSVGLTTPSYDTPLVWRSSVAVSALMQFLEDVEWGELDFLIIDMPPGTGDIQLSMAEELPLFGAILVTTPQTISCDDVSRAVMMFKDVHVKILGIVENMSYFITPDTHKRYNIFGKDGAKNICKKYNLNLLGQIPLEMTIREMSDNGKIPIALANDKIKENYKNIVTKILEEV
ncbi:Mrp/NBP35 family ATP-binding protein [Sulfurospirillum arcachonense]|uniref:Mrp/NBP35 family ATP-binding protein n=1 Tax=Sulfurospirillum arcachonense TaxID=57666 RepID=UPI000468D0BD|nr:Mrp/NBP35 family ATP-binding protein [Sulfurospirillum arcachonense]